MIQLYFLSILCNGFSGYLLFAGSDDETAEKLRFSNPVFYLVLGIISAVVGVLKLLSPIPSPVKDGRFIEILILGDLLPAAAGVAAGLLLIFGIYRQDKLEGSFSGGSLDRLGSSLLRFRRFIGLGLLAVALLHFLLPRLLFL